MSVKVSVIIPNFNHAIYLEQRIGSVLNQTYQDFEIILLDDASTDNSVEILKKYENHPKVSKLIINESNSGSPFKQWVKGIKETKGEYIWIAESDDWTELNFLETIIILLEDPEVIIGFCESERIESGNVVPFKASVPFRGRYPGPKFIAGFMTKRNYIPNASAVLFRKSFVCKEMLDRIQHYKFTGDWIFWTLLLQKGYVHYSVKPLNHFRKHNDTVTEQMNKEIKEIESVKARRIAYAHSPLRNRLNFRNRISLELRFYRLRV